MQLDSPPKGANPSIPERQAHPGESQQTAARGDEASGKTPTGPPDILVRSLTMLYEVCWIAAWAVVLFTHRYYIYHLYIHKGTWMVPLWIGEATVMGSLGGVIYSIYGMYSDATPPQEVTSRWLWFLIKPVNGAVLGAVCGLLARLVLGMSGSTGINDHILVGGVGLVAGMYEHFALRFIRRFSDARLSGKA